MARHDDPIRRLEHIARRRHGIFRLDHVREAGLSRSAFDRIRRRGLVQDVHRGTYAFGCRPLTFRARCRAAVDANGPGTVVTGAASEYLYGLRKHPPAKIEVLAARRGRDVAGVKVRQTRQLPDIDVTVVDGIPTVRFERLLVEIAPRHSASRLCWMIDEVAHDGQFSSDRLDDVLRRHRNRRRRERVVEAHSRYLAGHGGAHSGFECETESVVGPYLKVPYELNRRRRFGTSRMRPDMYIPALKVAIESDGFGHGRPTRRRQDARRDRDYAAAGVTAIRIRHDHKDRDWRMAIDLVVRRQKRLGIDVSGVPCPPLSR